MNSECAPAGSYKADLANVIAEFHRLAPTLSFENDDEEVLTVVCDSLKPEEFAASDDLPAWFALKRQIGCRFAAWIVDGREWKPLARLLIEETDRLYHDRADFRRVAELSTQSVPAEVAAYMISILQATLARKKEYT